MTTLTEEQIAHIESLTRPPRKWADSDRTEVTPEWRIWRDGQKRRFEDDTRSFLRNGLGGNHPGAGNWANEAIYFPEERGKVLPENGGWVIVIDPPTTVAFPGDVQFHVPLLSMWFAKPHLLNVGRIAGRNPYQAVIQTPAGDLHLWPHEYVPVSDPERLIGEDGAEIHTLGGDPLLDPDRLFYLRSRGISGRDATLMLFSEINQTNFCYVTFPPKYVTMSAGVGCRPGSTVLQDFQQGLIA